MKYILLLFSVIWLNGQDKQFIYEYRFIADSTQQENVSSEIMVLNIGKDQSEYFSRNAFVSDSTLLADSERGIFSMPPNKRMIFDRVIKYPHSNKINYITKVGTKTYNVSQEVSHQWKLVPEFTQILGYKAQKATTEYGGRKWMAWFCQEIPFQDGPYKFKGLPGLIVKLEDHTKSHGFELKGIRNIYEKFSFPQLDDGTIPTNNNQYIKIYRDHRINPVQVNDYMDYTDSEGRFHTAIESFKESKKNYLERIARDNNIIELNLIKNIKSFKK